MATEPLGKRNKQFLTQFSKSRYQSMKPSSAYYICYKFDQISFVVSIFDVKIEQHATFLKMFISLVSCWPLQFYP